MGKVRRIMESTSSASGTLLVDYTSPAGPEVTHVRSTLISSSLQTLREFGHYERYLERLDREFHDAVLLTLAPTWLPVDVAMAHYGACDALELTSDDLEKIGEAVSARIMGTFLGHLTRSARSVGASPWIPFKRYGRLWSRLMMGGRCRVMEIGPKDAQIECTGMPMVRYRYFSEAYLGVIRGSAGMFAKTVYVRRRPSTGAALGRIIVQTSWV